MTSVLTKKQKKARRVEFTENGRPYVLIAQIRHDDQCGNGHNTFSITGDLYGLDRHRGEPTVENSEGKTLWLESCGCLHEEIAKRLPQLEPYLKWHLCSTDGPMHYIANTLYAVLAHGPTYAWVYYTGQSDPLGIGDSKEERLLGYEKAEIAKKAEGQPGYTVKWDETKIKVANLDHARSAAIWPEATDEELNSPDLKEKLEARLPKLMADFQAAVESLGMVY